MTDAPMTLDQIERGTRTTIKHINWQELAPEEGKRLRALGIDEGAQVSVTHRGVFGTRDPLAIMIGRMTIAVRKAHAAAMEVERV